MRDLKQAQKPLAEIEEQHKNEMEELRNSYEKEKEEFEAQLRNEQLNLLKSFEFEKNDIERYFKQLTDEREDELQNEIQTLQSEYEKVTEKLTILEKENKELNKEVDQEKERSEELVDKLQECESQNSRLKEELEKEKRSKREPVEEKSANEKDREGLKETVEKLSNVNVQLSDELERERKRCENILEKVHELEKEQERLLKSSEADDVQSSESGLELSTSLEKPADDDKENDRNTESSLGGKNTEKSENIPESKEDLDMQMKLQDSIQEYLLEIKVLQDAMNEKEMEIKQIKDNFEREKRDLNKQIQDLNDALKSAVDNEDTEEGEENLEDLKTRHKKLTDAVNGVIKDLDKTSNTLKIPNTSSPNISGPSDETKVKDFSNEVNALDDVLGDELDGEVKEKFDKKLKAIKNNIRRSHALEKLEQERKHEQEKNRYLKELSDERHKELEISSEVWNAVCEKLGLAEGESKEKIKEILQEKGDQKDLMSQSETKSEDANLDSNRNEEKSPDSEELEKMKEENEALQRALDELEKHYKKDKEELMEKLQTQHKEFVLASEAEVIEKLIKEKTALEEASHVERFNLGSLYYMEMQDELQEILSQRKEDTKKEYEKEKLDIILKFNKDIADLHKYIAEKDENELKLLQEKNDLAKKILEVQRRMPGKQEEADENNINSIKAEAEKLEAELPLKKELAELQRQRQEEHDTNVQNLEEAIDLINNLLKNENKANTSHRRYSFMSVSGKLDEVSPRESPTSQRSSALEHMSISSQEEIRTKEDLQKALENLIENSLPQEKDEMESDSSSGASSDFESEPNTPAPESEEGVSDSGAESIENDCVSIKKADLELAMNLERFSLGRVYYNEYKDSLKSALKKLAKEKNKNQDLEDKLKNGITDLVNRTNFGKMIQPLVDMEAQTIDLEETVEMAQDKSPTNDYKDTLMDVSSKAPKEETISAISEDAGGDLENVERDDTCENLDSAKIAEPICEQATSHMLGQQKPENEEICDDFEQQLHSIVGKEEKKPLIDDSKDEGMEEEEIEQKKKSNEDAEDTTEYKGCVGRDPSLTPGDEKVEDTTLAEELAAEKEKVKPEKNSVDDEKEKPESKEFVEQEQKAIPRDEEAEDTIFAEKGDGIDDQKPLSDDRGTTGNEDSTANESKVIGDQDRKDKGVQEISAQEEDSEILGQDNDSDGEKLARENKELKDKFNILKALVGKWFVEEIPELRSVEKARGREEVEKDNNSEATRENQLKDLREEEKCLAEEIKNIDNQISKLKDMNDANNTKEEEKINAQELLALKQLEKAEKALKKEEEKDLIELLKKEKIEVCKKLEELESETGEHKGQISDNEKSLFDLMSKRLELEESVARKAKELEKNQKKLQEMKDDEERKNMEEAVHSLEEQKKILEDLQNPLHLNNQEESPLVVQQHSKEVEDDDTNKDLQRQPSNFPFEGASVSRVNELMKAKASKEKEEGKLAKKIEKAKRDKERYNRMTKDREGRIRPFIKKRARLLENLKITEGLTDENVDDDDGNLSTIENKESDAQNKANRDGKSMENNGVEEIEKEIMKVADQISSLSSKAKTPYDSGSKVNVFPSPNSHMEELELEKDMISSEIDNKQSTIEIMGCKEIAEMADLLEAKAELEVKLLEIQESFPEGYEELPLEVQEAYKLACLKQEIENALSELNQGIKQEEKHFKESVIYQREGKVEDPHSAIGSMLQSKQKLSLELEQIANNLASEDDEKFKSGDEKRKFEDRIRRKREIESVIKQNEEQMKDEPSRAATALGNFIEDKQSKAEELFKVAVSIKDAKENLKMAEFKENTFENIPESVKTAITLEDEADEHGEESLKAAEQENYIKEICQEIQSLKSEDKDTKQKEDELLNAIEKQNAEGIQSLSDRETKETLSDPVPSSLFVENESIRAEIKSIKGKLDAITSGQNDEDNIQPELDELTSLFQKQAELDKAIKNYKELDYLLSQKRELDEALKTAVNKNELNEIEKIIERKEEEIARLKAMDNEVEDVLGQLNESKNNCDLDDDKLKSGIEEALKEIQKLLVEAQAEKERYYETTNQEESSVKEAMSSLEDELEETREEMEFVENELEGLRPFSDDDNAVSPELLELTKLLNTQKSLKDYLFEIDTKLDNSEGTAKTPLSQEELQALKKEKRDAESKLKEIQEQKSKFEVELQDDDIQETYTSLCEEKARLVQARKDLMHQIHGSNVFGEMADELEEGEPSEEEKGYYTNALNKMLSDQKTLIKLAEENEKLKDVACRQRELLENLTNCLSASLGEDLAQAITSNSTPDEKKNTQVSRAIMDRINNGDETIAEILNDLESENKNLGTLNNELSNELDCLTEKIGETLSDAILQSNNQLLEDKLMGPIDELAKADKTVEEILDEQRDALGRLKDVIGENLTDTLLKPKADVSEKYNQQFLRAPKIIHETDDDLETVIAAYEFQLDNIGKENDLLKTMLGNDLVHALLDIDQDRKNKHIPEYDNVAAQNEEAPEFEISQSQSEERCDKEESHYVQDRYTKPGQEQEPDSKDPKRLSLGDEDSEQLSQELKTGKPLNSVDVQKDKTDTVDETEESQDKGLQSQPEPVYSGESEEKGIEMPHSLKPYIESNVEKYDFVAPLRMAEGNKTLGEIIKGYESDLDTLKARLGPDLYKEILGAEILDAKNADFVTAEDKMGEEKESKKPSDDSAIHKEAGQDSDNNEDKRFAKGQDLSKQTKSFSNKTEDKNKDQWPPAQVDDIDNDEKLMEIRQNENVTEKPKSERSRREEKALTSKEEGGQLETEKRALAAPKKMIRENQTLAEVIEGYENDLETLKSRLGPELYENILETQYVKPVESETKPRETQRHKDALRSEDVIKSQVKECDKSTSSKEEKVLPLLDPREEDKALPNEGSQEQQNLSRGKRIGPIGELEDEKALKDTRTSEAGVRVEENLTSSEKQKEDIDSELHKPQLAAPRKMSEENKTLAEVIEGYENDLEILKSRLGPELYKNILDAEKQCIKVEESKTKPEEAQKDLGTDQKKITASQEKKNVPYFETRDKVDLQETESPVQQDGDQAQQTATSGKPSSLTGELEEEKAVKDTRTSETGFGEEEDQTSSEKHKEDIDSESHKPQLAAPVKMVEENQTLAEVIEEYENDLSVLKSRLGPELYKTILDAGKQSALPGEFQKEPGETQKDDYPAPEDTARLQDTKLINGVTYNTRKEKEDAPLLEARSGDDKQTKLATSEAYKQPLAQQAETATEADSLRDESEVRSREEEITSPVKRKENENFPSRLSKNDMEMKKEKVQPNDQRQAQQKAASEEQIGQSDELVGEMTLEDTKASEALTMEKKDPATVKQRDDTKELTLFAPLKMMDNNQTLAEVIKGYENDLQVLKSRLGPELYAKILETEKVVDKELPSSGTEADIFKDKKQQYTFDTSKQEVDDVKERVLYDGSSSNVNKGLSIVDRNTDLEDDEFGENEMKDIGMTAAESYSEAMDLESQSDKFEISAPKQMIEENKTLGEIIKDYEMELETLKSKLGPELYNSMVAASKYDDGERKEEMLTDEQLLVSQIDVSKIDASKQLEKGPDDEEYDENDQVKDQESGLSEGETYLSEGELYQSFNIPNISKESPEIESNMVDYEPKFSAPLIMAKQGKTLGEVIESYENDLETLKSKLGPKLFEYVLDIGKQDGKNIKAGVMTDSSEKDLPHANLELDEALQIQGAADDADTDKHKKNLEQQKGSVYDEELSEGEMDGTLIKEINQESDSELPSKHLDLAAPKQMMKENKTLEEVIQCYEDDLQTLKESLGPQLCNAILTTSKPINESEKATKTKLKREEEDLSEPELDYFEMTTDAKGEKPDNVKRETGKIILESQPGEEESTQDMNETNLSVDRQEIKHEKGDARGSDKQVIKESDQDRTNLARAQKLEAPKMIEQGKRLEDIIGGYENELQVLKSRIGPELYTNIVSSGKKENEYDAAELPTGDWEELQPPEMIAQQRKDENFEEDSTERKDNAIEQTRNIINQKKGNEKEEAMTREGRKDDKAKEINEERENLATDVGDGSKLIAVKQMIEQDKTLEDVLQGYEKDLAALNSKLGPDLFKQVLEVGTRDDLASEKPNYRKDSESEVDLSQKQETEKNVVNVQADTAEPDSQTKEVDDETDKKQVKDATVREPKKELPEEINQGIEVGQDGKTQTDSSGANLKDTQEKKQQPSNVSKQLKGAILIAEQEATLQEVIEKYENDLDVFKSRLGPNLTKAILKAGGKKSTFESGEEDVSANLSKSLLTMDSDLYHVAQDKELDDDEDETGATLQIALENKVKYKAEREKEYLEIGKGVKEIKKEDKEANVREVEDLAAIDRMEENSLTLEEVIKQYENNLEKYETSLGPYLSEAILTKKESVKDGQEKSNLGDKDGEDDVPPINLDSETKDKEVQNELKDLKLEKCLKLLDKGKTLEDLLLHHDPENEAVILTKADEHEQESPSISDEYGSDKLKRLRSQNIDLKQELDDLNSKLGKGLANELKFRKDEDLADKESSEKPGKDNTKIPQECDKETPEEGIVGISDVTTSSLEAPKIMAKYNQTLEDVVAEYENNLKEAIKSQEQLVSELDALEQCIGPNLYKELGELRKEGQGQEVELGKDTEDLDKEYGEESAEKPEEQSPKKRFVKSNFDAINRMAVEEKPLVAVLEDYKNELEAKERENTSLKKTLESVSGDGPDLGEIIAKYENQITVLENANREAENNFEDKHNELQNEIDDLRSTLEKLAQTLRQDFLDDLMKQDESDNRLEALQIMEKENKTLAEVVEEYEDNMKKLEREKAVLQQIAGQGEEGASMLDTINDYEDAIKGLKDVNKILNKHIDALTDKLGPELSKQIMDLCDNEKKESGEIDDETKQEAEPMDAVKEMKDKNISLEEVLKSYEDQNKRETPSLQKLEQSKTAKKEIDEGQDTKIPPRTSKKESDQGKVTGTDGNKAIFERIGMKLVGDIKELDHRTYEELEKEDKRPYALRTMKARNEKLEDVIKAYEKTLFEYGLLDTGRLKEESLASELQAAIEEDITVEEVSQYGAQGDHLMERKKDEGNDAADEEEEEKNKKLENLRQQLEEEKVLKEKCKKDAEDLLSDIVKLKMKNASGDVDDMEEMEKQIKEEYEQKQENRQLREDLSAENNRNKELENENNELKAEIRNMERKIKDLENALEKMQGSAERLEGKDDGKDLATKVKKLLVKNEDLEKELEGLKNQLKENEENHKNEKIKLMEQSEEEKRAAIKSLLEAKGEVEIKLQEQLALSHELEEMVGDDNNVEDKDQFAQLKMKNESLKEQLDFSEQAMKDVLQKYQKEIKSLETEKAKLEDDKKHESDLLNNKIELEKAALERLKNDYDNMLKKEKERQLEDFEKDLERERRRFKKDLEEQAADFERKQNSHKQELEDANQKAQKEKDELRNSLQEEKEKLQNMFGEQMRQKDEDHEKVLDELRQKLEDQMITEKAEMNVQFRHEKTELKNQIEKDIYGEELQKNIDLENDFQETLNKVLKEHADQIAEIEKEMRQAEERFREQKLQLLEEFENEKERESKQQQKEKKDMESNIENLLKEIIKLKHQRKEMRQQYRVEKQNIEEFSEKERIEIQENMERSKNELVTKLKQDHEKEIDSEKKKYEVIIKELQEALDRAEAKRKELEEKLRSESLKAEESSLNNKSMNERPTEEISREVKVIKRGIEMEYEQKLSIEKQRFEDTLQGLKREVGNLQEKRKIIQERVYNQETHASERHIIEKSIANYKLEVLSKLEGEMAQRIERERKPLEEEVKELQIENEELKRQRWEMKAQFRREKAALEETFEREKEMLENNFNKEKEELRKRLEAKLQKEKLNKGYDVKVSRATSPVPGEPSPRIDNTVRMLKQENLSLVSQNAKHEIEIEQLNEKLKYMEMNFREMMETEKIKAEKMKRIQERIPKTETVDPTLPAPKYKPPSAGAQDDTMLHALQEKDQQIHQLMETKKYYEEVLSELCDEAGLFELDRNQIV